MESVKRENRVLNKKRKESRKEVKALKSSIGAKTKSKVVQEEQVVGFDDELKAAKTQVQVFEKEHKVMMKAMEAMIATHESKQEIARQAVLRLQVCSFTNHSRIAVTRAFAI